MHCEQEDCISLKQNLRDAGCDNATVAAFMELRDAGEVGRQLSLLETHRTALLDKLHSSQRAIDCLDFLTYKLKKERIR